MKFKKRKVSEVPIIQEFTQNVAFPSLSKAFSWHCTQCWRKECLQKVPDQKKCHQNSAIKAQNSISVSNGQQCPTSCPMKSDYEDHILPKSENTKILRDQKHMQNDQQESRTFICETVANWNVPPVKPVGTAGDIRITLQFNLLQFTNYSLYKSPPSSSFKYLED